MAEIPDHLVPIDGFTSSFVRFDGLKALHEMAEPKSFLGFMTKTNIILAILTFAAREGGSVDSLIADAHRRMTDVLRQWLYMTDVARQGYVK